MNQVLRIILVALWSTLLGVNTSRSADSAPAEADPGRTQNPSTPPPDSPEGVHYQRWKSCVPLLYPGGSLTASEIEAEFQRPQSIQQLLENLKLAWRQDLLLEPSFYNAATLQKFFAGSAVTWREPEHWLTQNVGFVVGQLENNAFPGLTARAESRCWQTDYKPRGDAAQWTATVTGYLSLQGTPLQGLTLKEVRNVLGAETENVIDPGVSLHGFAYTPVTKGSVVYADRAKSKAVGGAVAITFYFTRDPSHHTAQVPEKIDADDVVQSIEVQDMRRSSQEK